MWQTENYSLRLRRLTYGLGQGGRYKSGQIIIEIKDNKAISYSYISSEFSLM
jgi:hypothetical protein